MVFKKIITSNNNIQDFYTVLYKTPLFYALCSCKNGCKLKRHKSKIKNDIPVRYNGIVGVSITEHSQPKGIKLQISGHKLR
jgi:hypothetical protein